MSLSYNAPFFFPRLFHLQPHNLPTWTKFSVFFIENTVPKNHKYNNHSKRFALNQLKVDLYALMDKRNLHPALFYFTCMYCPKVVIHSNQIKLPMASGVDYIISRMSQPFSKVLSLCTGTQNVKIFIWNSSVEFISHHLPWKRKSTYKLQKSIPLRYENIFMTESIRPLWEVMLMFFQFLKSSGYMCNLCSQNETSITKFGQ